MLDKFAYIILFIIFFINLILFFMFILGNCYVFKQSKKVRFVALYSVFIGAGFLLNTCFSVLYMIFELFKTNFLSAFVPLILAIFPFVIGKFTTYDNIKLYINIQIAQLFIALAIIIMLIKF